MSTNSKVSRTERRENRKAEKESIQDGPGNGLAWVERTVLLIMLKKAIKKANNMKGSFKTTIGGWGTLLIALGGAMVSFSDGTLDINDFQTIVAALAGMGIFTGYGLSQARDNKVTSKKAGAE